MVFLRRLAHVVSVIVLFADLGRAYASQPAKQPQPRRAEADRAGSDTKTSQPPITLTITTPEKSPDEKKADAARADRQDATNQRIAEANDRMATFTFYLVWVGLIEVLATVAAFAVSIRAANAAKRSANIADRALHISQRAYITVSEVQFKRDTFGPLLVPILVLEIRNSGHLPATVIDWAAVLMTDEPLPDRRPNDLIWRPQPSVVAAGASALVQITMKPGEFRTEGFSPEEWAKIQSGAFMLGVYGAVRYKTGFDDMPGETGFGFIYQTDLPNHPHRRFTVAHMAGYNYAS